jgi:hypothetical protein
MFWTRPTAWVVVGVALAAVLVLALIEFLGTPPVRVVAVEAGGVAAPSASHPESRAAAEPSDHARITRGG